MAEFNKKQALNWIQELLSAHGLSLNGSPEIIHERPWSTVMRVATREGSVFFKAGSPVFAHEAGLTEYLASTCPEVSPDLLGADRERNWLLMRDSGTELRTFIRSEHSLTRWQAILPQFISLQKGLSGKVNSLLALGVPDRRLEKLPKLFDQLIQKKDLCRVELEDGLSQAEYAHLHELNNKFESACEELDALPIRPSLHHDDFHDGNLFLSGSRVIFTDWGESAVSHPFFSLIVLLRGAENSLEVGPDSPEISELRRWYLAGWRDCASKAELERAASLAGWIGLVNRALTWSQTLAALPETFRADYVSAVPAYLKEFIEQSEKIM